MFDDVPGALDAGNDAEVHPEVGPDDVEDPGDAVADVLDAPRDLQQLGQPPVVPVGGLDGLAVHRRPDAGLQQVPVEVVLGQADLGT